MFSQIIFTKETSSFLFLVWLACAHSLLNKQSKTDVGEFLDSAWVSKMRNLPNFVVIKLLDCILGFLLIWECYKRIASVVTIKIHHHSHFINFTNLRWIETEYFYLHIYTPRWMCMHTYMCTHRHTKILAELPPAMFGICIMGNGLHTFMVASD